MKYITARTADDVLGASYRATQTQIVEAVLISTHIIRDERCDGMEPE